MTSSFSIQPCTAADLTDTAIVWVKALANDSHWTAMVGPLSFEDEVAFVEKTLAPRLSAGEELGACRTWKVVDEDGKMVAWAGLGIPQTLPNEAWARIKPHFEFPVVGNQPLVSWFQETVIMKSLARHGYDHSQHFQRQGTMVLPSHQRRGLGRLLTAHVNAIADQAGEATYVRSRPGSAGLFIQEGFEVLERLDFDLGDFGVEGFGDGKRDGRTAVFVMRRLPGAKSAGRGARLDWGTWANGLDGGER